MTEQLSTCEVSRGEFAAGNDPCVKGFADESARSMSRNRGAFPFPNEWWFIPRTLPLSIGQILRATRQRTPWFILSLGVCFQPVQERSPTDPSFF